MPHIAVPVFESGYGLARRMVRIGGVLLFLAVAASLLNAHGVAMSGVSLVWLPNGLLIGVLICAPRREWLPFVAMGWVLDTAVNGFLGNGPLDAGIYAGFNVVEVLVAAHFASQAMSAAPDLTRPRQLRSFLFHAVLLAPAVASTLAALYMARQLGVPLVLAFRHWFAADVLGIAVITPLYLSFHQRLRFSLRTTVEAVALLALLGGVTWVAFRVTPMPMLWVVLLCLLLCEVRVGFTGSAAGLLLVTCVGGYLTAEGYGPFTLGNDQALPMRVLMFQCFVALCMLALYVTDVGRTSNKRLQASLEGSELRFRSLAETCRDVLVLAELDGRRQYVSPAATELVGFTPEEMAGRTIFDEAHAEDRAAVEAMFGELVAGQATSPLAYRSVSKDGGYRWIEVNARLSALADGEAQSVVYVMRDIADRKEAEEKLLAAFRGAERLALVDGLTGLANRRLLDETLVREWQRSMREKTPLALLVMDVDEFKSFNDLYGHVAGDECLRAVAEEVRASIQRTTDLLARFGGEEFVGVLPNTTEEAAAGVAERARKAVEAREIPHAGSRFGRVTISVGIAMRVAAGDEGVNGLLEAADAALYRAKAGGRNRSAT